jgi:predicted ABC-type ATPase
LGDLKILNPDVLAKKLRHDDPEMTENEANLAAVVELEAEVERCIEAGESVLIETVLSTRKYERHVLRARELDRYVGMIYVALPSVEQAIERVRQRKSMGGHDVPEDKIRSRWQRSLDNLVYFTPLVDRLMVFSNASDQGDAVLVARKREGVVEVLDADALPELTGLLLPLSAKP